MNILILMSGSSRTFLEAGYLYPKNLVEVAGVPLVQKVLEKLIPPQGIKSQNICILQRDENIKFHTGSIIKLVDPNAVIVELKSETSGAACSALLAVELINNDEPLIIVNGDQLLDFDVFFAVADFEKRKLDGGILTFEDLHPRWSFVKCDKEGLVVETAEKRPISKLATAGFYYFAQGRDFVCAAMSMIIKGGDVNGLFYICPVFNELVLRQKKIGVFTIDRGLYHSVATPTDAQLYNSISEKVFNIHGKI
jgi:NDP-sugar pyrophosphorylase family protein